MSINIPKIKPLPLQIPKLKLDSLSLMQANPQNFQTSRTPSLNCLGYTFRACHDKVTKDKSNHNNYLYDLQNTFNLSFQLIDTILQTMYSSQLTSSQHQQMLSNLSSIKELYLKKQELNTSRIKIRSKLLVDDQICQESKRRHNEMTAYYKDQVESFQENLERKSTLMKKFHKKFNEVEMYVINTNNNYSYTQTQSTYHEIDSFLYFNDKYLKEKPEYIKMIIELKKGIGMIYKENIELRKRDNCSMHHESTLSNSIGNSNNNSNSIGIGWNEKDKLGGVIQVYMKKNKKLMASNDRLKQMIRTINSQLKLKNLQKNILEAYHHDNDDDSEEEEGEGKRGNIEEKESVVHEEDVRPITDISNIDQSDLFNNKQDKKCMMSCWDISCIEKDQ